MHSNGVVEISRLASDEGRERHEQVIRVDPTEFGEDCKIPPTREKD